MNFKRKWCAFFTGVTGLLGGGITITALLSKSACSDLSHQIMDLLQTFLKNEIGVAGKLKMEVSMGDSDYPLPINAKTMMMTMQLHLNETLLTKIDNMVNIMQSSCEGFIWQSGMQDIFSLLLLTAAATGVVFAYHHNQPKHEIEKADVREHFIPQV